MIYLLSFIGAAFATGLLYYRELYKKCEEARKAARKNRYLWENWGE